MKTACSFYTVATETGHKVYFSKKTTRSEVFSFDVSFDIKVENPKLIAELAVIRHVLFETDLVRKDITAETVSLQCSQGAIKKLVRRSSNKTDGYTFARFINTRLPGVEINIKHDKTLLKDGCVQKKLKISKHPQETEETVIGKVKLTEHAVARFHERFYPAKPAGSAAVKLLELLHSPALKELDINDRRRMKAVVRHQKNAKYWEAHDACFVTVTQPNGETALVTVLKQQAA
ncbi:hypothetical protein [Endozoicomonas sp. ALC066]|uniref:hypothetical protein n=1 Tax=Endozoicomonas sp. ALC066 TaxID=3403078 RepID=UPI003BB5F813